MGGEGWGVLVLVGGQLGQRSAWACLEEPCHHLGVVPRESLGPHPHTSASAGLLRSLPCREGRQRGGRESPRFSSVKRCGSRRRGRNLLRFYPICAWHSLGFTTPSPTFYLKQWKSFLIAHTDTPAPHAGADPGRRKCSTPSRRPTVLSAGAAGPGCRGLGASGARWGTQVSAYSGGLFLNIKQ